MPARAAARRVARRSRLDEAGIPAFMRNYDMRWALGGMPGAATAGETGGLAPHDGAAARSTRRSSRR